MKVSVFPVILIVLSLFFVLSCKKSLKEITFPDNEEIVGLATPIRLNVDKTEVELSEYFNDITKIEKVETHKHLEFQLDSVKKIVILHPTSDSLPAVTHLRITYKGYSYDIPVIKSSKIKYTYQLKHLPHYQTVQLKGEMNGWNIFANSFEKVGDVWKTTFEIEPGNYQYLICVNGNFSTDPYNPDSVSNGNGGYNSLLKIAHKNETENPVLFSKEADNKQFKIGFTGSIDEILVFYQNHRLHSSFINQSKNTAVITIPTAAKNFDRTYLRIYACNSQSHSNFLLIPLAKGKVIDNVTMLSRTDYESAIIYNVFVDRFYNGNTSNDKPLNSPLVHKRADYLGGDINGITQIAKKGYFDSLFVNTIWISPIVKNPDLAYGFNKIPETKFSGYHGYWPISFTEIDPRMGTENEFTDLVNTLHSENKNILLDLVAHHVHEQHPYYLKHPDRVTKLLHEDGVKCIGGTVHPKYNAHWDGECRLKTWFDEFLPTLDLANQEVADMLADSAVYWIKKYQLDGFRHDATKHIPINFWQTLTSKLKSEVVINENRKIYQIGETYGSPELISSYMSTGKLDAQFDFNLYDAALRTFAVPNANFTGLLSELNKSFQFYGNHHLMGNISGNQDRGRFISYAGGDLKFDENAKHAGWTREINVGDEIGYKKSALLFCFNSAIPGIPVIYYGDEIGMPGGNDPDCRRMMIFNNLSEKQQTLKNTVAKLFEIRSKNTAVIFGETEILYKSDYQLVIARTYFDNIVVYLFNIDTKATEIEFNLPDRFRAGKLQANFNHTIKASKYNIICNVEASGFEVLTLKK